VGYQIKFTGLVINRQPTISVLFEVKAFKISKIVSFLVDSGSKFSAITEKEATIMGIDCSSLPDAKMEAVGFGGSFRNRNINREVILTFKSNQDEHRIKLGCFQVNCIPLNLTREEREKLIRLIPNVLGMDILRTFRTCFDAGQVELTLLEK